VATKPLPDDILSDSEKAALQGHFDSTENKRTVNNVMRHEYRVLADHEKIQMRTLKDLGLEFVVYCDTIGSSRELSLAKTKIEEAAMWAVKHITR
jgi:hypothetical protein